MKQFVIGLAVSAMFFAAQTAHAQAPSPMALVHADSGNVLVQGKAVPSKSSFGANAGDSVAVNGGQATVTYGNGCEVKVTGAYQIAADAPVCTGAVAATGDGKVVAAGLGAIALIVGGVAAGGGGGGGGGGGDGSEDGPSSP